MLYFSNEEITELYRENHRQLMEESQPIRDEGFEFEIKSNVEKELRIRELKSNNGSCEYWEDYIISYEFTTNAPQEYVDIMSSSVVSKWGGPGSKFWKYHKFDVYQKDPSKLTFELSKSGIDYDNDCIEEYEGEKDYFENTLPDITLED